MKEIVVHAANGRKKKCLMLSATALGIIFSLSLSMVPVQAAAASCATFSSTSNTITVTCDSTISQVSSDINNKSALKNLGRGQWLLNAILRINDGAKLTVASSVSWLKIEGSNGIVVYGRIDVSGSKITSWDRSSSAPISQTSTGSTPRAYINLQGSEGGTISGAEIAYLGYSANGKRGIDLYGTGASHDLTISNSKVHDNWMGFYSNGAYSIVIDGGEFYRNIKYAIDPHSATKDMRISNVNVHNNLGIAVICSDRCSNIMIENNIVHDNSQTGLMLSRATTNSVVRNNVIYNQLDAFTISVSESQNNLVYGNRIKDSTNGITVHNPTTGTISTGNQLHDNSFDNVNTAFRAQASAQNTFSNNNFVKVNTDHYLLTSSASVTIEHQTFSNTKIHATPGNNDVTIQNSGKIQLVGSSTIYDTGVTPFKMTLNSKTITVNSVS